MAFSANEQYLLELINRARLDPADEALRLNHDLNADLAPNTITTAEKQVLAPHVILETSAIAHSQWMLDENTFSHTGEGGSSAHGRIVGAGYQLTGSWGTGENIAWIGTTGTINPETAIYDQYIGLYESASHRENTFRDNYESVGLAQEIGYFTYTDSNGVTNDYHTSMLTENFANNADGPFLTGAIYSDSDNDAFYSIGEGTGSVSISVSGGPSTTSTAAGGYGIDVGTGTHTVTIGGSVVTVEIGTGNAKLDLIDTSMIQASTSITLVSGASNANLLGLNNYDLTGNSSANILVGNKGANVIDAGAGNDDIGGGEGNDILRGGAGNDTLDGGAGVDTASYVGAASGVNVDLQFTNQDVGGGQGIDTLTSIENLSGSDFDDRLSGDTGDNFIAGGGGNDILQGGAGNDTLDGAAGVDTASYEGAASGVNVYLLFTGQDVGGGQGIDTLTSIEHLFGSDFDDRLSGDSGDNVLTGGDGDDILNGKDGDDSFFGGGGIDKIRGGSGTDYVEGGGDNDILSSLAGDDVLYGNDGEDLILGGRDSDTIFGGNDDDVLRGNKGNDAINGDAGEDQLRGGSGSDTLNGGADRDFLFGESGIDTLTGGAGDDSLTGGFAGGSGDGAADTFIYSDTASGGGGSDRIKDFEDGVDLIDLSSFGFTSFLEINAGSVSGGTATRLDFGGGDTLHIENFVLADFDAGDVIL